MEPLLGEQREDPNRQNYVLMQGLTCHNMYAVLGFTSRNGRRPLRLTATVRKSAFNGYPCKKNMVMLRSAFLLRLLDLFYWIIHHQLFTSMLI